MDILSHALVGGLVASVGLQKKYGLFASATMVAANLIPDLDGTLALLGPRYFFQYHRHPLTHSLGGAVLLSAALATVVCLATPLKRPGLIFGIGFGGIVLHLLGDLLTPWPIPLLWPFTAKAYSLDLVGFLDPFLLAVLSASFIAMWRFPARGTMLIGITVLVVAGYLGLRVYTRQAAIVVAREAGATGNIAALPHGLSLASWDVIVEERRGYSYYQVNSLRQQVLSNGTIVSTGDEGAIAASGESALVRGFKQRARFPVAFAREDGDRTTVVWQDVHLLIGGGFVRGVNVVLDERGEIIDENYEFNVGRRPR